MPDPSWMNLLTDEQRRRLEAVRGDRMEQARKIVESEVDWRHDAPPIDQTEYNRLLALLTPDT